MLVQWESSQTCTSAAASVVVGAQCQLHAELPAAEYQAVYHAELRAAEYQVVCRSPQRRPVPQWDTGCKMVLHHCLHVAAPAGHQLQPSDIHSMKAINKSSTAGIVKNLFNIII